MAAIFHLSFPVRSLSDSLAFYETCLDAKRGRMQDGWCDVFLFGHQLTLHELPAQVAPREQRGVRHFGAIVDWARLEDIRTRVARHATAAPTWLHRDAGLPTEHAKLLVEDPDGNLVEMKSYRDRSTVMPG